MSEDPVGLSTPQVCALARLAPSTVDYWVRTGLIEPSIRASTGRRFTRYWTVQEAVVVRTIKALRDAGCPMQKVRRAKDTVDRLWSADLSEVVLYWDGSDVLALEKWGSVRSAVKNPGQQVLHLVALPITHWRQEAEEQAEPIDLKRLARLAEKRRRPGMQTAPVVPRQGAREAQG